MLKIGAGLFLAAIVALGGAAIALKKYLPPEKVRSLIIENAQKSLRREVRLDGVSLNVLSGLRVSKLEISEAPDFASGKFASIESFQLRVQLLPLLTGKVVVDQIELGGLSLAVAKNKKGAYNFDDLTAGAATKEEPAKPAAGPAKLPFELNVSRAIVSGGKIVYKDKAAGVEWAVSGIEAEIENFSLAAPFKVSARLFASGAAGEKPVNAKVFYKGALTLAGLDPARMTVGIDELRIEAEGFSLEAVGSVEGLGPAKVKLKTKLLSGGKKVLDADLGLALLLSKPDPRLDVSAEVQFPPLTDKDLAFVKGLPPGLSLPVSSFKADLSVQGLAAVDLRSLKIALGKTDLEIKGRITRLLSGNLSLALGIKSARMDFAELAAIIPQGGDFKVSGAASADLDLNGSQQKPSLNGRITLKAVGAVVENLALSGFGGQVVFTPSQISLEDLRGKAGDGSLAIRLRVRNYLTAPDIDLSADLSLLDLDKLFSAKPAGSSKGDPGAKDAKAKAGEKPKSDPPGTIAVKAKGLVTIGEIVHAHARARKLKLGWDLAGITPSMRKLSGSADLDVDSGEFESLEAISEKSGILKAVLFPLMVLQKLGKLGGIGLFPDLSYVKFSEITGRYSFRDGLMTLNKSRLVSTAATINTDGTIDLPEEKLALGVKAELGRIAPVELSVKGTFSDPKVRLNVGKTLAAPVEKGLKDILKGKPAKDVMKDLKGLFGR